MLVLPKAPLFPVSAIGAIDSMATQLAEGYQYILKSAILTSPLRDPSHTLRPMRSEASEEVGVDSFYITAGLSC